MSSKGLSKFYLNFKAYTVIKRILLSDLKHLTRIYSDMVLLT